METASLKFQDPQLHCLLNSTSISDTSHLETINVCLDNADLQLCQLEKIFQPIPKPGQNYWSTTHKAQLKLYAGCTKQLFETIHLIDIMDWYWFYSSAPCFSSCIWWVVFFFFSSTITHILIFQHSLFSMTLSNITFFFLAHHLSSVSMIHGEEVADGIITAKQKEANGNKHSLLGNYYKRKNANEP